MLPATPLSKMPPSKIRQRFALWGAVALFPLLASAQSPPTPWTIQPDHVLPGKSSTLKLLNSNYTSCYEFDQIEIRVVDRRIETTFRTTKKTIACDKPVELIAGPTFQLDGLVEGIYPVHYRELPACYPDCHAITQMVGPVDTLTVSSTTASFRIGAQGARPEVVLLDDVLLVNPSEGLGIPDRVQVASLSGTILHSYPVGEPANLPQGFEVRLDRGVYLVRLSRNGKEIHSRKILRN